MRTKTVTRHYCDHCSKGYFKRPTAARHEAVCYRNPKRVCARCNNNPEHKPDYARFKAVPEADRHCGAAECPDCLMAMCIMDPDRKELDGDWVMYPLENFKEDRREWDSEHYSWRVE